LPHKEQINKTLEDLIINNPEFRNSVKIGTSDTKVITYRLNKWCDELNKIIISSK